MASFIHLMDFDDIFDAKSYVIFVVDHGPRLDTMMELNTIVFQARPLD